MKNCINKPFFLEKVIFKCILSHYSFITRDPAESNQQIPIPYTHGINLFLLNNFEATSINDLIRRLISSILELRDGMDIGTTDNL